MEREGGRQDVVMGKGNGEDGGRMKNGREKEWYDGNGWVEGLGETR